MKIRVIQSISYTTNWHVSDAVSLLLNQSFAYIKVALSISVPHPSTYHSGCIQTAYQNSHLPNTRQKFRIASLSPRHLFLVRDEICSSHLSHHEYAVTSIMCDCTWLSRRGITDKYHPLPLHTHTHTLYSVGGFSLLWKCWNVSFYCYLFRIKPTRFHPLNVPSYVFLV